MVITLSEFQNIGHAKFFICGTIDAALIIFFQTENVKMVNLVLIIIGNLTREIREIIKSKILDI